MDWETACKIMEVSPDATDAEIKKKFKIWSFLLAPDANSGKPEDVVKAGEKEFIKKKAAKEYLLAPGRREEPPPAGPSHRGSMPMPTVVINPKRIRFKDVGPGEKKKTVVEIRICGGQYDRISFEEKPAKWLEVNDRPQKKDGNTTIIELALIATGFGTKATSCSLPIEIAISGHKIKESVVIEMVCVERPEPPTGKPDARPQPKPLLQITPRRLTFVDMVPQGTKITSFDVRNIGGPYTNYVIDTSRLPNWLEVTSVRKLTEQPLPIRVTLKATGQVLGTHQECDLPVKIHNHLSGHSDEIKVHIELVMRTSCIHIDRELIDFHTVGGMECPVQNIVIQNTGIGYVEGTAFAREHWIKVSPQTLRFAEQQLIQVQVDTSKLVNYDVGTIDIKTNAGNGLILVKTIVQYPNKPRCYVTICHLLYKLVKAIAQYPNKPPSRAKPNDDAVHPNFFCPKCKMRSVGFNRKTDRFECIHHPKLHHWKYLKDFDK